MANYKIMKGFTIHRDGKQIRLGPGEKLPKLSEEEIKELLRDHSIAEIDQKGEAKIKDGINDDITVNGYELVHSQWLGGRIFEKFYLNPSNPHGIYKRYYGKNGKFILHELIRSTEGLDDFTAGI